MLYNANAVMHVVSVGLYKQQCLQRITLMIFIGKVQYLFFLGLKFSVVREKLFYFVIFTCFVSKFSIELLVVKYVDVY